jgi:hypothetical protein
MYIYAKEWTGREEVSGITGVGCVHCYPQACLNAPHSEFGPNYHHGFYMCGYDIQGKEVHRWIPRGNYILYGPHGLFHRSPQEFARDYEGVRPGGNA